MYEPCVIAIFVFLAVLFVVGQIALIRAALAGRRRNETKPGWSERKKRNFPIGGGEE